MENNNNNIDDTTYDVVNSTPVPTPSDVDSTPVPTPSDVDSTPVPTPSDNVPTPSDDVTPSGLSNQNVNDLRQLTSFLSSILTPQQEINNNENIMSTLLRGMMQQFLQGGLQQDGKEEDDDEDNEDEDEDDDEEDNDEDDDEEDNDDEEDDEEDNDDEEDEDEDEDEDEEDEDDEDDDEVVDPNNIYVIKCDDKSFYTDTLQRAKKCMVQKFSAFLHRNNSSFIRMEKDDLSISAFERQPNTLLPYQETKVFYISISKVEKVTESVDDEDF